MKTRMVGLALVFLLAGLLKTFPGPAVAKECSSTLSAESSQPRCLAKIGKRGVVDITRSDYSSRVAVFSGPPKDGVACNGSLTIGDNVGWYDKGTPGTITDINLIAQESKERIVFGHHVRDVVTAGWLYRDERGNFWVQMNGRPLSEISSTTRAFFTSLGLPESGGLYFATTGRHPPNVRAAHLEVQRCWAGGRVFAFAG